MQCPVCGHRRAPTHYRCSGCGTTFPREALERHDYLLFLLAELDDWARRGLVSESQRQQLAEPYREELRVLKAGFPSPQVAAFQVPPPEIVPPPAEVMPTAPIAAEPLAAAGAPQGTSFVSAPAATDEAEVAAPVLTRPRLNWEALWQTLLSPRALEALLYVGAFLILTAAGTFVYFNWGRFSPPLQLLFLAAGTASFFIAGWLIQTRWHLAQSGAVLIGIGALIIPVDFYAWARFRSLSPESYPVTWLAASTFCTAAYAATTWWMRHRFFLVITVLAGHSLLLSALRFIGVPADWWGGASVLLAIVWVVLGPVLDSAGGDLKRAAFATAVAVAAAGVTVPVAYHPDEWRLLWSITGPAGPSGVWILPVAAAWWAASAFLASINKYHPSRAAAYATAGVVPIALGLTVLPLVSRAWISLAWLLLAPVYLLARARTDELGLAAGRIGRLLPVLALLWAWMDPRALVTIYLAASVLYLWWAFWLGQPVFALAAEALAAVGLVALMYVLNVAFAYWPLAILVVGISGVALGAGSSRSAAVARFLYLGAYAAVLLAVAAAPGSTVHGSRVALLAGGLLVAVYSAFRSHRGSDTGLRELLKSVSGGATLFHWAAAILTVAELAFAWVWWRPHLHGLPAAGLVVASIFVLLGRRLAGLVQSYAQPWLTTALALGVAAPVLAIILQVPREVISTLLLAAATYVLWSWLLDKPGYGHLGASLFLIPFVMLLPDARALGLIPSREAYAWAFAALGSAYFITGVIMDRRAPRFSIPWHLISQLLIPFALLWALQDEDVGRWTLAVAVLFYTCSAALAHSRSHPAFQQFTQWMTRVAPAASQASRAGFVYAAAWLFPFWFHLTLHHIPAIGHVHARFGIAAAALAWVYLGTGQWLRRADTAFVPPLRIASQALAVVGALLAADQRSLLIIAIALGVILQVGFFRLTNMVTWVYTSALGTVGLFGLILRQLSVPAGQASWAMMALGGGYLALGQWTWNRTASREIPATTSALFAMALLATGIGLGLASFQGPFTLAIACALGAVLFLWVGWRLQEPLFGYPVAGLSASAYVAGLVGLFGLRGVSEPQYGIWLIPGILTFFAAAHFLDRPPAPDNQKAWAYPFYVATHVGTAALMVHSATDSAIFPWALAAGAAIYGLFAAALRSPLWLYPALLTSHLAVFFGLIQVAFDPRLIPGVFVPVTMLLATIAYRAERAEHGRPSAWRSWALPWYLAGLVNIALWELVGIIDTRTHVITSFGFALPAVAIAQFRQDRRVASLAQVLIIVGIAQGVRWFQLPYPSGLLAFSLLAFLVGGVEVGLRFLQRGKIWRPGARVLALLLSVATLAIAVGGVVAAVRPDAGAGFVYALSVVGLLYLLMGLAERREWLAYLAVAMLEAAWAIFLLKGLQIRELQWYAIPAALYLLGVGAVERRLGRRGLAQVVDLAGLTLLLGSSLWQSLGPSGFPYAVLLAIEALLVVWFGAAQRVRRHFFGGLGALLVNVIVQSINPVRALDKTVLFLSLGVLLVVTAILAERRREQIIRTTRAWWTRLEAWE